MTRQALNHLLRQIDDLGYVERRSDPADGARRVYLTARGHAAMAAIREAVSELEAHSVPNHVGTRNVM